MLNSPPVKPRQRPTSMRGKVRLLRRSRFLPEITIPLPGPGLLRAIGRLFARSKGGKVNESNRGAGLHGARAKEVISSRSLRNPRLAKQRGEEGVFARFTVIPFMIFGGFLVIALIFVADGVASFSFPECTSGSSCFMWTMTSGCTRPLTAFTSYSDACIEQF